MGLVLLHWRGLLSELTPLHLEKTWDLYLRRFDGTSSTSVSEKTVGAVTFAFENTFGAGTLALQKNVRTGTFCI